MYNSYVAFLFFFISKGMQSLSGNGEKNESKANSNMMVLAAIYFQFSYSSQAIQSIPLQSIQHCLIKPTTLFRNRSIDRASSHTSWKYPCDPTFGEQCFSDIRIRKSRDHDGSLVS
ncbi:hypothetical protein K501DRAFT_271753 [Backusella circina FSU 941]|nr:hypothetical protein K501DRAFT_271753 [Backusella circina FSU 941]